MIFAFGAAPANAADKPIETFRTGTADAGTAPAQSLKTTTSPLEGVALETLTEMSDYSDLPHGFDVEATIELAESEIGTSRPTGWSMPGECIMSAKRWIEAGDGAWVGSGNPVNNYEGATRLTIADAQPGDIVQYEHIEFPTSWVTGVHTVLITEVHDDGTFTIIESNNPGGSGLVSKDEAWVPAPPSGFQAVVWRF
ncbi:CHAP domain-containing protein [Leucobacter weissii]|nr:CHAP domain-containing protein [Leucobacter weissii]